MENINVGKSMHTLMVDPYMFTLSCFTKTLSSKSINDESFSYEFQIHLAEKTFLYNSYSSYNYTSLLNSDNIDLFPIAVRYADIEKKIYIIERPPFQIDIDFYPNKKVNARLASHMPNKKMWIPWTVFVVSLGDSIEELTAMLFFNDKPLESLDDKVIKAYTPNIFNDGKVCFGNSLHTFRQRFDRGDIKYNISTVYNYMFNDYFTQWNPDISANYTSYLYKYFDDNNLFEKVLSLKKYPKDIEKSASWNSYFRSNTIPWIYTLFMLSTLTYEETMNLVSYFKTEIFKQHYMKHVSVLNVISPYLEKKYAFNFQYNEFTDFDYRGYAGYQQSFRNAIQPAYANKKVDLIVNVLFKGFPKDTDKSIVISENTYAYIYSSIFDKINESVNYVSDTSTLEDVIFKNSNDFYSFYSRFSNFFSWGSNHIIINYDDYINFTDQFSKGAYV